MTSRAYMKDCMKILSERLSDGSLDRRAFLSAVAAVGAVPALLALGGKGALAQDVKEIVVSNWGGDAITNHGKIYGEPYTAATGIPVKFDSSPLEGRIKAMVEAGEVIWDAMDLDGFSAIKLGRAGILRPINYTIVDRNTLPGFSFDHGVAWYLITYVLAYDTEKVSPAPTSWVDFWDVEKYPGKRTMWKWLGGALEAALMADGVAKDEVFPIDVERALAKVEELSDHLIFWDSGAESQQMFREGEVVMGSIWNSRAHLLKQDTKGKIDWIWNQGVVSGDVVSVPKDNPAGDAVWPFVASMQDPEKQVELLSIMSAAPTTPAGVAAVPPDLQSLNAGNPENMAKLCLVDAEWWADNYDDALTQYTDRIAG